MTKAAASFGIAALAAFALLVACGASTPAPGTPAKADVPAPKFAPGPWSAALGAACTPSGPEQCFNAIDDNCNGIIDEGCGVPTGPLQFTIAWSEPKADVDLVLIDPTGTKVAKTSRSAGGCKYEPLCPDDGCAGQNVDNIYCDNAEPSRGRYVLEIHLGSKAGAVTPTTKVRVGVRVGDKSYGADLELSPLKDQETISFVL